MLNILLLLEEYCVLTVQINFRQFVIFLENTHDNAQIAREEGKDYETAEVLLERIKEKRERWEEKTITIVLGHLAFL